MLQTLHVQDSRQLDENLIYNIKMYMWCIDVNRRGTSTNENRKRTICLYCMFLTLRIESPFDDKIFIEDNKIPTEGNGGLYNIKFHVYEYKIADLIRSLLSNKVMGGRPNFVSGIDHIIDVLDIYAFPWGLYEDTIDCLRRINDLMFDILLI